MSFRVFAFIWLQVWAPKHALTISTLTSKLTLNIYINWGQNPKNALYTHTKCADSYTPLPDLKNGFPDPTYVKVN